MTAGLKGHALFAGGHGGGGMARGGPDQPQCTTLRGRVKLPKTSPNCARRSPPRGFRAITRPFAQLGAICYLPKRPHLAGKRER